jgi:predicted RNA-binding Zn ribbon-like protein
MKQARAEPSASGEAAPLLADHPALDFLNTRPGIRTGSPLEHIANGEALLRWLVAAGLLSSEDAGGARRRFARTRLDALAVEARELRERLRAAVVAWQHRGTPPAPALMADLNRLLAAGPTIASLQSIDGRPQLRQSHAIESAPALLTPVAETFAQLFCDGDRSLVRECEAEACSLWFYDRTKAHRRRWCSMGACGARAKAAAYRARNRSP